MFGRASSLFWLRLTRITSTIGVGVNEVGKRTWFRRAVNGVIVVAATGAASESRFVRECVDGSQFRLPCMEPILYAQEDSLVQSLLRPMSPDMNGQCWMVCECQCSDRLCAVYCRIECQPWRCQHTRGASLDRVFPLETTDCI